MNKTIRVLDNNYSVNRKKKLTLKFRLSVRARILTAAIDRHATCKLNLKILDLGAAEGKTLIEMSKFLPGNFFWGIEYSNELINSADSLPENIVLAQGDATNLPQFQSNIFDVVSALAVLEHLEKPFDAVKEAYRLLKPGGLFIATCPDPVWEYASTKLGLLKEANHESKLNKRFMVEIINNAGFNLIEYRKFMWAPIAFLPYLHIQVSSKFALKCDQWIEKIKIFNGLFVNQVVIGKKILDNP